MTKTKSSFLLALIVVALTSAVAIVRNRGNQMWTCVDAQQSAMGRIVLLRKRYSDGSMMFMDYFGFSDSSNSWWLTTIDVESLGLVRGKIELLKPDRATIKYGLETFIVQWTNRQFEVKNKAGVVLEPSLLLNPDDVENVEAAVRFTGWLH